MDGREARGGEDPIDLATAMHVELVVPPEEAAQPVEGQCRSADVPGVAGMDEPDEPHRPPGCGIQERGEIGVAADNAVHGDEVDGRELRHDLDGVTVPILDPVSESTTLDAWAKKQGVE